MRRRSILCRCFPPLMESSCDLSTYAVLTAVSAGYPPAKGRLPTYYSPVRHWSIAAPVRLACIRHAASVHPEPGSNSPLSLSSSRLSVCFGSFSFLLLFLSSLDTDVVCSLLLILFSFQCPLPAFLPTRLSYTLFSFMSTLFLTFFSGPLF